MSSETSTKNKEKSLFISDRGTHLITHDGYIQLGIFNHSLEKHKELNPHTNWVEVYWIPDKFSIRYPRVTWQDTEAVYAGSPKTDNATDCRPRDFPQEESCRIVPQEETRLNRSV